MKMQHSKPHEMLLGVFIFRRCLGSSSQISLGVQKRWPSSSPTEPRKLRTACHSSNHSLETLKES